MMINIVSVCVLAVFAVILGAALRKENGEIAALLLTAAAVLIAFAAVPYVQRVTEQLSELSEQAAVKAEYMQALVRAVGICVLTRTGADICRENGGQSAASGVELFGRLAVLLIACPLYADLIKTVGAFLSQ